MAPFSPPREGCVGRARVILSVFLSFQLLPNGLALSSPGSPPYQCMARSWENPKVLLSLKTKQNIPTKFEQNHLQHLQFYYVSVFLPGIYLRKGSLGYEGVGFGKLNQTG